MSQLKHDSKNETTTITEKVSGEARQMVIAALNAYAQHAATTATPEQQWKKQTQKVTKIIIPARSAFFGEC